MEEMHVITGVDIFGDSLSDRGTLYKRKLFGFISLNFFSGLQGRSPRGSFTNGYIWTDHLIATLANDLTVKRLQRKTHWQNDDIADAVLTRDRKVAGLAQDVYDLRNDERAKYRGRRFVRTYTEGGLTSYNYHWVFTWNIIRFITRLLMSYLGAKRRDLFNDDRRADMTAEDKAKRLVIEWSGANDMVTVNKVPDKTVVDRAITKRIEHVEKMIEQGYKHFYLFNLPDIAMTPRYKTKKLADSSIVKEYSEYFNSELEQACARLRMAHEDCNIDVYDISGEFAKIFADPEKYGVDPAKIDLAYTESDDYKKRANGTFPSDGFLFWDGIHPSADAQARMADAFLQVCKHKYKFKSPIPNDALHCQQGVRK